MCTQLSDGDAVRRPRARLGLLAASLAGLGAALGGCQTRGAFHVDARPDGKAGEYRVFLVGNDFRRDAEEGLSGGHGTIDPIGAAISEEMKKRGYVCSRDPEAPDLDAYLNYRVASTAFVEYGGYTSVGPGGTQVYTPTVTKMENQRLEVEVFDWSEVVSARGDVARLSPVWRGSVGVQYYGNDGCSAREASELSMHLLAQFPVPTRTGGVARDIVPLHDRPRLEAQLKQEAEKYATSGARQPVQSTAGGDAQRDRGTVARR